MARRSRIRTSDKPRKRVANQIKSSEEVWSEELMEILRSLENVRKTITDNKRNSRLALLSLIPVVAVVVGLNYALVAFSGFIIQGAGVFLVGSLGSYFHFAQTAKAAELKIEPLSALASRHLLDSRNNLSIALFGISEISKSALETSARYIPLTTEAVSNIDENGNFALGDYKELGVAIISEDGTLDHQHRLLEHQYWIREKRRVGLDNDLVSQKLKSLNI